MSAADRGTLPAPRRPGRPGRPDAGASPDAAGPASARAWRTRRFSTRLFRSELWLIFGRRRNWVGLAVLCTVPILVNIATKISAPAPGQGPPFVAEITGNGLF